MCYFTYDQLIVSTVMVACHSFEAFLCLVTVTHMCSHVPPQVR